MRETVNDLGQPIGFAVPDWRPPPRPARAPLDGRRCRLEPLDPERHAEALHAANARDGDGRMWTYLPYGPFATLAAYRDWLATSAAIDDPLFFAIVERERDQPIGVAARCRINPPAGAIEVGHLAYSPLLQRSPVATEAMYLLMRLSFDLGYRRYEWKCHALNAPSRAAAQRLGFTFEGIFRQATVVKGRNRDTTWFSILDHEWPPLRVAFERWLDPANFDAAGQQRLRLSDLTRAALADRR